MLGDGLIPPLRGFHRTAVALIPHLRCCGKNQNEGTAGERINDRTASSTGFGTGRMRASAAPTRANDLRKTAMYVARGRPKA